MYNQRITSMLTPHTKIVMLQKQIAILSLSFVSMQEQMKQMEISINSLKTDFRPIVVTEPTPEELAIQLAPTNLDIDDSDSDGYDSDDGRILAPKRVLSKIQTKTPKSAIKSENKYVLISDDGNESGYDDSDSEQSHKATDKTYIPIYEPTRLNPFETDRIASQLQKRAMELEEI